MSILDIMFDGSGASLDWDSHEQLPPPGGIGEVEEWIFSLDFEDDESIPTRVVGTVDRDDHMEIITLQLTKVTPYGPPSRRRWRGCFVETERTAR